MSGECYTNKDYPKLFPDHHDCIRAGLSESYEIIYAEGNFTRSAAPGIGDVGVGGGDSGGDDDDG